ncbi:carbamoyltransferase HypF [Metallosphaera javensis (ex Sakai et al. 2022)]|uniref:carbamoyltransferase HypF n=1 Tax=Metallosphaera javensis (ex Sakai et al. 2022) TaxID=2775498 RepID=UPI00258FEB4D|nr:MAG: carbamoyltransferase HypF [Metallosphaera javensis (ex Sakai et al. 2022)]
MLIILSSTNIQSNVKSFRLTASGIVQGVGFRPFVFRIALKSGVRGFVRNLSGSEVEIVIQGNSENISRFFSLFFLNLPPMSRLEQVTITPFDGEILENFKILKSEVIRYEASQIPPDFSVCSDCMREVLDSRNRRYRYPFNSCVNCGPRFSMMMKVPYDRENTAMSKFPLCDECAQEYSDPDNERRFDAQGISCPKCGPRLYLEDLYGNRLDGDPIALTGKLLAEGKIIAIKGIGGFHIACDPFNDDIVLMLRARKGRPSKPFAIMSISSDVISNFAEMSPVERDILESPERPIVLLRKREDSPISRYVSPGLDREGFFLYYTPLHYMLLSEVKGNTLIMTSANKHGYPMCVTESCVKEKLNGIVDYLLYHDRDIVNRVDDSVIKFTGDRFHILRRGRGYAPLWIRMKGKFKGPAIALGAELQNAGAVMFDDKVILTQYVGDTDRLENLREMEKMLNFLMDTYNVRPRAVLVDKNPSYQSRQIAQKMLEKFPMEMVEVQHHFAHVLSVAADHGLDEGVAIAIDGVGYGDDGNAWGGEILRFAGDEYERAYHLKYVPYPGGDVNALKPRRMLAIFLSQIMSLEEAGKTAGLNENEIAMLRSSLRVNRIYTSSTGRFLDSVSAFLGVCDQRRYEGEPAIMLEASARGGRLLDLNIPVVGNEIDTSEAFRWLLSEQGKVNDIALTVQYRLGEALAKAALKLNPQLILFSGGAAVNEYILKGLKENSEGIEVITPRRVPSNDGGIALGQAHYLLLSQQS